MTTLTITEGLAELKTLAARIEKKREAIMPHLLRLAAMVDPLARDIDGGQAEFIRRERQGIADLAGRYVAIRVAIQRANLNTMLTLGGEENTIAGWLIWRRELAEGEKKRLDDMARSIGNVRQEQRRQGRQVTSEGEASSQDIVVNVSEVELAAEVERLETLLGELDGKLSLLNATTTFEIPG